MNGMQGSPFCLMCSFLYGVGHSDRQVPCRTPYDSEYSQHPWYLDAADRYRRDELVERNHRYAVERLVAFAAIAKKTVSW